MVMGNCLGCGERVPMPLCFCGHQPCDRSPGLVLSLGWYQTASAAAFHQGQSSFPCQWREEILRLLQKCCWVGAVEMLHCCVAAFPLRAPELKWVRTLGGDVRMEKY